MNQQIMNNNNNNNTDNNNILDVEEIKTIQQELINRGDGKYIKVDKPKDDKLIIRRELTLDLAICLVYVYKHYRYSELNVKITDYFPKKILLQYLSEHTQITRNFKRLKYWDLITPMPISPTEIKYKKGWYGITENGIAFVQKEIGLPKYAFVYNDYAFEHQTNPYVMITDLIKEDDLELILKP